MFKGDLVYLRAMEPEDATLLYTWENDPASWQVSNTLAPYSLQSIREFITNTQDIFAAKQLRLIICTTENDKRIGAIDLFDFDPFNLRAGVGILIADKDDRRKNYANESLKILIDYSFQILGLKQLYCNIDKENIASVKLFQKQGFQECGIKKAWHKSHEGWRDEHMYQLINDAV